MLKTTNSTVSASSISALTSATTPLAGTEVLPIVQSGSTVKVSVANLTAGRDVSALTLASTTGSTFATVSGSVGVGTASPQANVHIAGASNATVLKVSSTDQATGMLSLGDGGSTTNNVGVYRGAAAALSNGNFLNLAGYDGVVFTASNAALGSQTERMRIAVGGNVGIGNTAPQAKLQVLDTLKVSNAAQSQGNVILGDGGSTSFNVGIGRWNGSTNAAGAGGMGYFAQGVGNVGGHYFYTGDAAAGSTTLRTSIDPSGIVTMSAYGAGAATFSAAGVISSVSDENWKRKDGVPTNPTEMLGKLQPGYWYYNDKYKDTFGVDRQLGFYAQNVNAAIGPEAAPEPESVKITDDQGVETLQQKPWGYYDRSVLAVVVMALQEALETVKALEVRIQTLESK